jgi:hypothetical protein
MIYAHTLISRTVENKRPDLTRRLDLGLINSGHNIPFVFDSVDEYLYYYIMHPWITPNITKS